MAVAATVSTWGPSSVPRKLSSTRCSAAEDTPEFRPGGNVCKAIDHAELMRIMAMYGRVKAGD
jgi:hypothetical protein